jgi:1-deoxy-D-xylulose-5-phosphate synthase
VKVDWRCPLEEIEVGTGRCLKQGEEVAVLSIGPYGNDVAKAVEGTKAAHYDMRFLKPLDDKLLHEIGRKFRKVITVENGVRNGGLGSAVLEWMSDHGYTPQVVRMGLPDAFVEHGSIPELQKIVGMDVDSIRKTIQAS